LSRIRVTLKLATSLDGKIALSNGESEWVTGEAARRVGRSLRGTHDAIAIGSGTAVTDNPQLTTRLGDAPNPIRVIFDTRLRLRTDSNLAQTANETAVIIMTKDDETDHAKALKNLGVRLVPVPLDAGHVAIEPALEALTRMGVESLLLEGGGHLAAAFLRAGRVDQIEWFAPVSRRWNSRIWRMSIASNASQWTNLAPTCMRRS